MTPSSERRHRIYLDHAASNTLHPEASAAMAKWMNRVEGNPSSLHHEGREARDVIDCAREIVSSSLGCLFAELIFTSSGTEAANLAIVGATIANEDLRRKRILFSATEHHCVLNTMPILSRLGYAV